MFGDINTKNLFYINIDKIDVIEAKRGKGDPLLTIKFELGNKVVIQTRRVYSFLSFGGDIGGLWGCIQPIFATLVALFSGALYNSELIRDIYPVHNTTFEAIMLLGCLC